MRPIFCPQCGQRFTSLDDMVECFGKDWEDEKTGKKYYSIIYDCYCQKCDWSGDISPDDELDMEGDFRQADLLSDLLSDRETDDMRAIAEEEKGDFPLAGDADIGAEILSKLDSCRMMRGIQPELSHRTYAEFGHFLLNMTDFLVWHEPCPEDGDLYAFQLSISEKVCADRPKDERPPQYDPDNFMTYVDLFVEYWRFLLRNERRGTDVLGPSKTDLPDVQSKDGKRGR